MCAYLQLDKHVTPLYADKSLIPLFELPLSFDQEEEQAHEHWGREVCEIMRDSLFTVVDSSNTKSASIIIPAWYRVRLAAATPPPNQTQN